MADVVPLVDENRVLVHHGLESLARCPTLGLATLMKIAKIEPKINGDGKPRLDSEDIGFSLAPRLNAAGRLAQAQLGVELLVTDRPDRALELAQYIDQLNGSRQTLERSMQLAAKKQIDERFNEADDPAFVLAERGWHAGVIGIVAGRLAEKHHRPVVLISLDQMGTRPGIGSARSVPGFNLHAALEACDECLLAHGGHAAAAGLKIEEDQIDAFRTAFCEVAAAEISQQQRRGRLVDRRRVPLERLHHEDRLPDRAARSLRAAQRPALAVCHGRHAGRPAESDRGRRAASFLAAFAARREPAGRGLRRGRMGRTDDGPRRGPSTSPFGP